MTAGVRVQGSIRRRLLLQLLGTSAVLAVVMYVIVLGFVRDLSEQSHGSILTASAQSILDSISVSGGEVRVDLPYAALSMLGNVSDDRVFYRVTQNGAVLTGYDDLPPPRTPDRMGNSVVDTVDYNGNTLRMVTLTRVVPIGLQPTQLQVSVGQTQDGQALLIARWARTAVAVGIGFFMLAVALAVWTAQTAVRPLETLTRSISRRGPKDLRPVARPVPAEMAPLVSSLNTFMGRLSGTLSRTEDFIAEAAHRVRTPLATVRMHAQVTQARVTQEANRASLREMIRAIDETPR